ncbi:MAG TPA: 30S ribosomal protein S3 [Candidatus Methylomirabilis sp.]|nr:30S ribosomal protein S3 [Candidatus Methylomirabilis sp.]
MGKKVNPKIFRIGINKTWPSVWFASGQEYIKNTRQDVQTRRFLMNELKEASVDNIRIERGVKKIVIDIASAKPGIIIGRGGNGIEELKKKVHAKFLKNFRLKEININIKEFDRPNLSAQIVLQSMIADIEKRMPFKRVMKQAVSRVEKAGALGVKVMVSGRLNGAEIAREEKLVSGKIPLQTLRADIDYSRGAAHTSYGTIGVKIWIYKGEIFEKDLNNKDGKGEILGRRK